MRSAADLLSLLSFLFLSIETYERELYNRTEDYNKNFPPSDNVTVSISLFINRVSAVDESKAEISLDVFLRVYWEDKRISLRTGTPADHVELTWEERHEFWIPDLYIRQLQSMRVLSVFQEMSSVRVYKNSTIRVSIGATVIVKCDMDFGLYPLDVQRCPVDFSSYKYTLREMTFRWRDDPPLSFPSDFDDGYRLPKYVVNFIADPEMQIIYYGEGNHSTARLMIDLSREIRSHLLETYLPSSLFVIMSWGGFVVIPEVVPGRMVLLVTTLLSLVTMFDTVRNNSPNALELKCIEVWLISCILFVFFALLEYFVVLFGIRYEKHWQKKKEGDDGCNGNHVNHVAPRRTENLRLFHPKVFPHQDGVDLKDRRTNMMHESYETTSSESSSEPTVSRRERARQIRDRCFLFCGSQQGTLDKISLALFPICFVIFNLAYWVSYIAEARRRMQSDT